MTSEKKIKSSPRTLPKKHPGIMFPLICLVAVLTIVGYLFAKNVVTRKPSLKETANTVSGKASTNVSPPVAVQKDGVKVIAYYFHGNIRCSSCRRIEAYAREALKSNFPKELKEGRLEFRVVNVAKDGNEHFRKDYKLSFQTVILSRRVHGKEMAWKNLKGVWKYIGNKQAFFRYIRDATEAMLKGKNI